MGWGLDLGGLEKSSSPHDTCTYLPECQAMECCEITCTQGHDGDNNLYQPSFIFKEEYSPM